MSVFLVVFSEDKSLDSRYHTRSCPEAKLIVPPNRRLNNPAQLKQWGYTPCPKCRPDDLKKHIGEAALVARDGRRQPKGARGGCA